TSAEDVMATIEELTDEGEVYTEPNAYHLIAHLDIVLHYEKVGNAEKVVDHMEHFKALVQQFKVMGFMSDKAYERIISESNAVLDYWQRKADQLISSRTAG